ncbi:MAG TPA: hypothetical protein VGX68_16285 [Thermoanaerobaculia bacterium]|nr:hypothetical protein [Thermoanaerobaculia bacterium]
MDHPSHEELAALGRETLPANREREVVRHLLFAGCPECLAAMPPSLSALLGLAPARRRQPTPEEEDAYDAAIERASAKPLALERHLREQRAEAEKGLKLLEAGRKLPRAMGTPGAHVGLARPELAAPLRRSEGDGPPRLERGARFVPARRDSLRPAVDVRSPGQGCGGPG